MGKKKAEDILNEDKPDVNMPSDDKQASLANAIVDTVKNVKNASFSEEENAALWHEIHHTIEPRKNTTPSLRKGLVAAIVLFLIGAALYLYHVNIPEVDIQKVAIINKGYLSKSDDVQFINADKKTRVLHDTLVVYKQFVKQEHVSQSEQVGYNSIGVPYGKRSEIVLEDGTKVWLNAGSILTFPEKFNEKDRAVYLEGEGYFEIAKDANRPFFVLSEVMKIQVLGTSFNLSAYADDDYVSVLLLTGNIALLPNGNQSFERRMLKPGTEARFGKSRQKLLIQPASESSISWTNRRLLLNSMNLEEMLKKLERFYNAEIELPKPAIEDETFSGSLDLTQTLPEVLQNIFDVSKYTVNQIGRRVYIQTK